MAADPERHVRRQQSYAPTTDSEVRTAGDQDTLPLLAVYRMSATVTSDSEEVVRQRQLYIAAIGGEMPPADIEDILQFAKDAQLPAFYASNKDEDVWFEMLKKPGLEARVGQAADKWCQIKSNIDRASNVVGRKPVNSKSPRVKDFGFCRFKAPAETDSWYMLAEGAGTSEEEQTIVVIALEELGPHNGFPFPLACGQDVCVDGNAPLWTPPTGGGLALCFSLDL